MQGKSGLVFKIYFANAYDHVDWGFLDFVLRKKVLVKDGGNGSGEAKRKIQKFERFETR